MEVPGPRSETVEQRSTQAAESSGLHAEAVETRGHVTESVYDVPPPRRHSDVPVIPDVPKVEPLEQSLVDTKESKGQVVAEDNRTETKSETTWKFDSSENMISGRFNEPICNVPPPRPHRHVPATEQPKLDDKTSTQKSPETLTTEDATKGRVTESIYDFPPSRPSTRVGSVQPKDKGTEQPRATGSMQNTHLGTVDQTCADVGHVVETSGERQTNTEYSRGVPSGTAQPADGAAVSDVSDIEVKREVKDDRDPFERTYVDMAQFRKEMEKEMAAMQNQSGQLPPIPSLRPRPYTQPPSPFRQNTPLGSDVTAPLRHTNPVTSGEYIDMRGSSQTKDPLDRTYIDMTGIDLIKKTAEQKDSSAADILVAKTNTVSSRDTESAQIPPPTACRGSLMEKGDNPVIGASVEKRDNGIDKQPGDTDYNLQGQDIMLKFRKDLRYSSYTSTKGYAIIKNLPPGTKKEDVEKMLEEANVDLNTIKIIQVNSFETILTFNNPEDAESCAEAELSCDGDDKDARKVLLKEYFPDVDCCKAFITGIPLVETQQMLDQFLTELGIDFSDIQTGLTPGTALVTFPKPSAVNKLYIECDRKPLADQFLKAYPVHMATSVQITMDNHQPNSLINLREHINKCLGSSPEEVPIIWDDEAKIHIATLRSIDDVNKLCKTPEQDIGGTTVTVRPYYPCLRRDPSYIALPSPIELDEDTSWCVAFAMASKKYNIQVDDLMKESHSYISKGGRKVVCTVDRMSPGAKLKINSWARDCETLIKNFVEPFKAIRIITTEESWQDILADCPLKQDSENQVAVMDLCQDDCSFVLAGEKDKVLDVVRKIEEMEDQLPHATRKRNLEPYQFEIVQALIEKKQWKKPKAMPIISESDRFVRFEGSPGDTRQSMNHLTQILQDVAVFKDLGLGTMRERLLANKQTASYIKSKLRLKRHVYTYTVSQGRVHIYTYPEKKDIQTLVDRITPFIIVKQHQLHANEIKDSLEWQTKLFDLQQRHEGFFLVELTSKKVDLVCVDAHFDEIYSEVLEFCDSFRIIHNFFEIDLGKWRFLEAYRKPDIMKIKQKCEEKNVAILESDSPHRKGFTIHGRKTACKTMIPMLQALAEKSVYHRSVQISYPSVHEIVQGDKFEEELAIIELENECGIHIGGAAGEEPSVPETQFKVGGCNVVFTERDVTSMHVHAVVNPVDASLQNKTLVGAAIVEKVGFDFQRKCDEFIQRNGIIEPGCFFINELSTQLPSIVINVVVPFWVDGQNNECQILKSAIENSLKAVIVRSYAYVVIPSLDNFFNFPPDESARVTVETVIEFLANLSKSECSLRTVYLCASTPVARQAFEAALKLESENICGSVHSPTCVRRSAVESVLTKSTKRGLKTFIGISRISQTEREMTLHVIEGEIGKMTADAIVCSVTSDLNLMVGSQGRSLLEQGGQELQDECRARFPDGVRLGEVAVVPALNLNCKHVFLGTLKKFDEGKGHAEKVMCVFIANCLYSAGSRGLSSIAFAALGTGKLSFPPQLVAALLRDSVYTYQLRNPESSLKKVYLVALPEDHQMQKDFKATISDCPLTVRPSYRTLEPVFFDKTKKFLKSFGNISVEIVAGDITKEMTHSIVNSVNNLNLDTGIVSKAIFSAAGPAIQSECNTPENKESMRVRGLVSTGGGNLDFCRTILHLAAKDTKSEWKSAILNCLKRAECDDCQSISFPALGTGGRGMSPTVVAEAMFEAIRNFCEIKSNSHLRRIRIVIFDTNMIEIFKNVAATVHTKRLSLFGRRRRDVISESLSVHLYAASPTELLKAESAVNRMFATQTVRLNRVLVDKTVSDAIDKIGKTHRVVVVKKNGEVRLHGLRKQVRLAQEAISSLVAV